MSSSAQFDSRGWSLIFTFSLILVIIRWDYRLGFCRSISWRISRRSLHCKNKIEYVKFVHRSWFSWINFVQRKNSSTVFRMENSTSVYLFSVVINNGPSCVQKGRRVITCNFNRGREHYWRLLILFIIWTRAYTRVV